MKRITKIIFTGIVLIFNFGLQPFKLQAQDIHFSQFVMTPLLLDPSQAGKGNDQRVIINYRNQWSSVASPYKTYGFSYDTHFNKKQKKDNFFGIGVSVYNDKAGDINLGLTTLNLSLSYHIKLNQLSFLSAGIQGGVIQGSIDDTKLRFQNQFDGSGHNAAYSSEEVFNNTSFFQPDFGVGVSYFYTTKGMSAKVISDNGFDGKKVNVGVAVKHVANTSFSFLEENTDKLNFRYVLHSNTSFGVNGVNLAIQPSGFITYQEKAMDLLLGSYFRYNLKEKSKYSHFSNGAALSLGIHYRVGDALIPSLLVETGSLAIAISYDFNLSGLSAASNGRGGYELSIRYVSPNPFGSKKTSARFF